MIELFLNLSERSVGSMQPGQWNYIKAGLARNVQKVQQFYQTFNPTVRSNHFLIRLLQTLSVPHSLALDRYYANVDAIALNHSASMGMTSAIAKGRVHRGVFYGANTPELLVAVDDFFDFEEVDRNWENVSAVKPLMHAKSDTQLLLPNGLPYSQESGLTVILVNVPMLAVQYRAFMREEQNRQRGTAKTIAMFIGGYVLPNMLPAHMELCLFNRLYLDATEPASAANVPFRAHSFRLPQYDYYLDDALETYLEYVSRGNLEFQAILKSLPSLFEPSMYQAMQMPDIAPTRQVDWVLVAARLKVVDFLFKVSQKNLLTRNQHHVNQILRAFRMRDVNRMFQTELPPDALREVEHYTSTILQGAERDFF